MEDNDLNILMTVWLVALVLAIGFLVYGLGRMIFRPKRSQPKEAEKPRQAAPQKPAPQFQHSELGFLVYVNSVWCGETQRNGRTVCFAIAGSETAPDEGLLDHALGMLGQLATLERTAAKFLRDREAETRNAHLDFDGFHLADPQNLENYAMEFVAENGQRWVVRFEEGQPVGTGGE